MHDADCGRDSGRDADFAFDSSFSVVGEGVLLGVGGCISGDMHLRLCVGYLRRLIERVPRGDTTSAFLSLGIGDGWRGIRDEEICGFPPLLFFFFFFFFLANGIDVGGGGGGRIDLGEWG